MEGGCFDKAQNLVNAKYTVVLNLINVRVFLCNKVGLGLLDWGLQLYISPEKGPIREGTYFKRVREVKIQEYNIIQTRP